MIYRTLGNTGLKVSQLGFGAMRLPMTGEGESARVDRDLAIPMIHRAFEAGVNYIDTAVGYCASDSQCVVGEALKGWREKIIVSTKNHDYGTDEKVWWQHLEDSLERLQIDCIDVYNHHGIGWQNYTENVEPRVSKWMMKARDQGLIKHICTSFHDNNDALMKIVDTGYPAVITVQYNLFDRSLAEAIAHAHAKGIGVVVMGPVGGGRLGVDTDALADVVPGVRRIPELAVRFVLANPAVSVCLSGMSTMEQVEENITTACNDEPLADEDIKAIESHLEKLKEMADLYCTGCGYCKPCPEGIDIPRVFGMYNEARVYGFWDRAKRQYAHFLKNLPEGVRAADACTECGKCEEKCPQNIPIREQLKESQRALTTAD